MNSTIDKPRTIKETALLIAKDKSLPELEDIVDMMLDMILRNDPKIKNMAEIKELTSELAKISLRRK